MKVTLLEHLVYHDGPVIHPSDTEYYLVNHFGRANSNSPYPSEVANWIVLTSDAGSAAWRSVTVSATTIVIVRFSSHQHSFSRCLRANPVANFKSVRIHAPNLVRKKFYIKVET